MLYVVGVNHGYQVVGEYPGALFDLPDNIQMYQRPFFEWLKAFVPQKKIDIFFEEWPLIAKSKSSAANIAEDSSVQYVQIDDLPQNDNQDIREDGWIKKIAQNFSNTKTGLVIVGDKHCDNLKRKFESRNIKVEITRQREIEEKLIPKNYNDIVLTA